MKFICRDCKQEFETTDPTQQLCQDALERLIEDYECALNPNYDRTKLNEYPVEYSKLVAWPTQEFKSKIDFLLNEFEKRTGKRKWPDFWNDNAAYQEAMRLSKKKNKKGRR